MKKRLYIIWSCILVAGFVIWGIAYLQSNRAKQPENKVFFLPVPNYLNAVDLLSDLQQISEDTVLLTIGYGDCHLCQELVESEYYGGLDYPKKYMDITLNDTNRIVGQALYAKSFPTTYIIAPNLEVLGNIEGTYSFPYKSEGILSYHHPCSDIEIHGVGQDSVLSLMSCSLRALASLWDNRLEDMRTYALHSLEKGSYFFNNYLLYHYYRIHFQRDSAFFYRRKALRHNHHVNTYIYENLIDSLQTIKL